MKKNYFMLAATAALFAACAETDLVNEVNTVAEPQAIGFETFINKATRAASEAENSTATTTTALNTHHADFAVWAYKNTDADYVFGTSATEGVKVNSSTYAYSPTKYWDKSATKYEFYAAAPDNGKWELIANTTSQADDYFTYEDFSLIGTSLAHTTLQSTFETVTDCDLMIASATPVTSFTSAVPLEFNHILSRLNITVKKGSDIADTDLLELKSISVNNLVQNGTFTEGAAVKAGTTGRWSNATTPAEYDIHGNALATVTKTTATYVFQALVIPQNVQWESPKRDGSDIDAANSEPYILLNYEIGGEPYKAVYNLAAAFGSTGAAVPFNEGYQNTLNITINATGITFTAVTFDWVDKPGTLPID